MSSSSFQVGTGTHIGIDFLDCTKRALSQAEEQITSDPSVMLLFTGSNTTKGNIKESLDYLKNRYPNIEMVGCSNPGLFGKQDYGLLGVSICLMKGISAESKLIKRFRMFNSRKTTHAANHCDKWNKLYPESCSGVLLFPPGLGFPKTIVRKMAEKAEKFNIFAPLNLAIWRKFPSLSRISGPVVAFFMNLLGIGISYTSSWVLFKKLHQQNVCFTGTFGVDPITFHKALQYRQFKCYQDSLVYICLGSNKLNFKTYTDHGAQLDKTKPFSIDFYLKGGFVPQIDGEWGRDAFFKRFELQDEVYYAAAKGSFYYNTNYPICILDEEDHISMYTMSANPNIKQAVITAPDQILSKLKNGSLTDKAFFGVQSLVSILEKRKRTINKLGIDQKTKIVLTFDCANRAMLLGDRFHDLVAIYQENLKDIPFLGVMSGGEFRNQTYPIMNFSSVSFVVNERP